MRRLTGLVLVLCAAFLATAANAGAGGTTVSVSGTTATITVNLDIVIGGRNYPRSDLDKKTLDFFNGNVRGAEQYWNQAFARLKYRGCTQFKLNLNAQVVPGSESHWVWKTEDYIGDETVPGHQC